MYDLIFLAGGAIVLAIALAYAFVAVNRHLAARRDERLKKHLSWTGGHRTPRVSAAPRA